MFQSPNLRNELVLIDLSAWIEIDVYLTWVM